MMCNLVRVQFKRRRGSLQFTAALFMAAESAKRLEIGDSRRHRSWRNDWYCDYKRAGQLYTRESVERCERLGHFNIKSGGSYFVANEWSRVNHGCTLPDGYKLLHGCETAGWVCLGCSGNLIARNQCTASANCYYMSGERGLASNNNRFLSNYCAAATDNCFELTFSRRQCASRQRLHSRSEIGASLQVSVLGGGVGCLFQKQSMGM